MILPSAIHIAKADEILHPSSSPKGDAAAVEGIAATSEQRVISRDAIVNKTNKMCATGKSNLCNLPNPPSPFCIGAAWCLDSAQLDLSGLWLP